MTDQERYYNLTDALFAFRNHKTLEQFLAEIIEQLRVKGYDCAFCARFLEKTLRNTGDRLATFGEWPTPRGSPSDSKGAIGL